MTAIDTARITKTIARRNGLDYFTVVVPNWGGPGVNQITLNRTASLAGISIAPNSTVSKAFVIPAWGNLIGNAPDFIGSGGADSFATDLVLEVSVDRPLQTQMAGPVNITAAADTLWADPGGTLSDPFPLQLLDENALAPEQFDIVTGLNFVDAPHLILNCWLRPGAANVATKRFPFYRNQRTVNQDAGIFDRFMFAPIGGRRHVQIDLWAQNPNQNIQQNRRADFAVDVYRAEPQVTTDALYGERVYPPVPGGTARLKRVVAADSVGRNHSRVVIEDPNALFVSVKAKPVVNGEGPDLYCSLVAKD